MTYGWGLSGGIPYLSISSHLRHSQLHSDEEQRGVPQYKNIQLPCSNANLSCKEPVSKCLRALKAIWLLSELLCLCGTKVVIDNR